MIACNLYVSTAHRTLLMALLHQAQRHCTAVENAIVVHAYADTVYKRSSFHLAGHAEAVSAVASDIAVTAIQELRKQQSTTTSNGSAIQSEEEQAVVDHPNVGLVDHISMMPLTSRKEDLL